LETGFNWYGLNQTLHIQQAEADIHLGIKHPEKSEAAAANHP